MLILILLLIGLVTPGWGSGCKILSKGVDASQRTILVKKHNDLRSFVATGSQGLPSAANMKEMVWDNALASEAQAWANRCEFEHGQIGGEEMGQNLAWSSQDDSPDLAEFIQDFFDEVSEFNPKEIKSFYDDGPGHFTQVIWANTYKVGCGLTSYDNGDGKEHLLVCNYSPTGNVEGKPIYEKGKPCSKCAGGSGCGSVKGLCPPSKG